jgi:hypothetical protein
MLILWSVVVTGASLADAAAFQAHIVAQYSLSADNKWVVFGGSYSGCLSAWAKYEPSA